jgi:tautomerase-like protein
MPAKRRPPNWQSNSDVGTLRALSASTQLVHPKPWRLGVPFVTFTVRRGVSAADKSRLSEAMLEAQVAAGYHRADRFHRFLEVDQDDLLVDPRFPDYATDRTDRFMVVEVVISSGRPTGTAATIADEAVRLFGERLHLAPQDVLFVFHEVEPNLPRFPAACSPSQRESHRI